MFPKPDSTMSLVTSFTPSVRWWTDPDCTESKIRSWHLRLWKGKYLGNWNTGLCILILLQSSWHLSLRVYGSYFSGSLGSSCLVLCVSILLYSWGFSQSFLTMQRCVLRLSVGFILIPPSLVTTGFLLPSQRWLRPFLGGPEWNGFPSEGENVYSRCL